MGAGKVLYHWRVFPIHLSEAPTLPLTWTTTGNATASLMLASTGQHDEVADRWQDAVQQHLGSGGAVLAGRLQPEMRAARECRAWPLAGVPSEGPVILRCAARAPLSHHKSGMNSRFLAVPHPPKSTQPATRSLLQTTANDAPEESQVQQPY